MAQKILAFSCTHAPFTPRKHIEWLLGQLREYKPDVVVNLGDWFESAAASVHPNEHGHTLEKEYQFAANMSKEIRGIVPKARLVWTLGNHDDNIQTKDARRIPANLRSLVHWNASRFGEEFRLWEQYPHVQDERCLFRCGQVVFYHGFAHGKKSDGKEAKKAAEWSGWHAKRLFIRGHTHQPKRVTQIGEECENEWPWYYANVGTIGPLKPDYMKRKDTTRWGVACAKVECDPKARMGKAWDCEIVMR